MAALTFGDVYAAVLLRAPGVDPLLAREWVQDAYREACDHKVWSHQRSETAIVAGDQKTGTVTVTKGSATITAGTLVLAATDVGRQIRITSVPIYTIIAVANDLATATLDRVYSEASGTTTFTILDAYWTAPENFWRFLAVVDPVNKWRLRWWVTEDDLSRIDPGRMSTGSPWALVSQAYSPVAADLGKARFEVYPYPTTAKSFSVLYYTKPTVFAETDTLIGPFAGAKAVLVDGALARCALWPGTSVAPNRYFNLGLADRLEKRFAAAVQQLEVKDEDLYPTFMPAPAYGFAPGPFNADFLQSHELRTIESAYY